MEVIQLALVGYVVYALFRGGNKYVIVAAFLVAVWFPQIPALFEKAVDIAVGLLQSATGAL